MTAVSQSLRRHANPFRSERNSSLIGHAAVIQLCDNIIICDNIIPAVKTGQSTDKQASGLVWQLVPREQWTEVVDHGIQDGWVLQQCVTFINCPRFGFEPVAQTPV